MSTTVDVESIAHLDFDHEEPCGATEDSPFHPVGVRRADFRLVVKGCSCIFLLCDEHTQWAIQALTATGATCDCRNRTVHRADVDITPLRA